MLFNILELVLVTLQILFLVLFFVILKKNGEETIEEVKGKLIFLANAILITGILFIAIAIADFVINTLTFI